MEPCDLCPHPFDGHIVMPYDNPLDGGLIFCHEFQVCKCVRTWSVQGRDTGTNTALPPEHVVEEWRQALMKAMGNI